MSVEISPDIYRFTPETLRPIFSSSTSLATVLVVLLSVLFRLGVSKQRTFTFRPGTQSFDVVYNLLEEQGATWGMRREVEQRANRSLHEVIVSVLALNPRLREMDITLEFDELRLTATIDYDGASLVLPDRAPTADELLTDDGVAALSGFMIRQFADRVRVKPRGSTGCRIQLQFDH